MKREEFIKWLDEESTFSREFNSCNGTYWEELVNYADYIWDYLEVEEDTVVLRWEEMYWGGSTMRNDRFEFEEFIERYRNYTLKF